MGHGLMIVDFLSFVLSVCLKRMLGLFTLDFISKLLHKNMHQLPNGYDHQSLFGQDFFFPTIRDAVFLIGFPSVME
jgi:hypothetical protein